MGVSVAKGEHMGTKHQVRFVRTTSNPQFPNRSCRVLISFCLPKHSRGPCGLGSLGWHASGLGSLLAVHTKVIIQMWLCQLLDTTQRKTWPYASFDIGQCQYPSKNQWLSSKQFNQSKPFTHGWRRRNNTNRTRCTTPMGIRPPVLEFHEEAYAS